MCTPGDKKAERHTYHTTSPISHLRDDGVIGGAEGWPVSGGTPGHKISHQTHTCSEVVCYRQTHRRFWVRLLTINQTQSHCNIYSFVYKASKPILGVGCTSGTSMIANHGSGSRGGEVRSGLPRQGLRPGRCLGTNIRSEGQGCALHNACMWH